MPEASVTWTATNPVTIDWGDGSAAGSGGATGTATHTFAIGGPHTITVTDTVTMAAAQQTIDCPVAACTLALALGPDNRTVTATLTAGATDTHTVDWGDGTTSTGVMLNAGVDHTYTAAGVYTVTARNDTFPTVGACTASADVTAAAVTFSSGPGGPVAGVAPYLFQLEIDQVGGATLVGAPFDVDWGDGSAHAVFTGTTPPIARTHTYSTAGSYTPTVCRTDTSECHPMTGGPVVVS